MSKKIASTTEEAQTAMRRLQQLQFQKQDIDKQYAAQFNAVFLLVASLPDSEIHDMLYASLQADDNCSGKRKRENDEDCDNNNNTR
jgi:hypothetical protein